MLTSVDKMFIRFIFAKDMQLHYIWYYKILIKNSSCYPCGQFLISLCFPLQKKSCYFLFLTLIFFFFYKKNSCSWEPAFDRDMINITTCDGNSTLWLPIVQLAASPCGCCLAFLMRGFRSCSWCCKTSCAGRDTPGGEQRRGRMLQIYLARMYILRRLQRWTRHQRSQWHCWL